MLSDCYLFPYLKEIFRGRKFIDDDIIRTANVRLEEQEQLLFYKEMRAVVSLDQVSK